MKNFWASCLGAFIGVLIAGIISSIIIVVGVTGAISSMFTKGAKSDIVTTAEKTSGDKLLHIKLNYAVEDRAENNPLNQFRMNPFGGLELDFKKTLSLYEVTQALDAASKDDQIKGIILDFASIPTSLANTEEIRKALVEFKKSGKYIYAYSYGYTQKSYYLASVADSIYLYPLGGFEMGGLGGSQMYFKNTLEKLGVDPIVVRPTGNKFKSAVEPFIYDKSSPENRIQTMKYLTSIWDEFVAAYSAKSGLSIEEINRLANTLAISEAEHALQYNLVDRIVYRDEFEAAVKKAAHANKEDNINLITLEAYYAQMKPKTSAVDKIAVIYAAGSIVDKSSKPTEEISPEPFVKAIKDAVKDNDVKAIVLRVNSPGGSALASDIIWREIVLAKKSKPVVVSMGGYAASGGYYISCAADTIVADANTITGSIGVFSIMFNSQKLFNKHLGVTMDTIKTHQYADFPNAFRPMSARENEVLTESVNKIYQTFLSRVAEGRKLTTSYVDSIGQGRVWTGKDALELGLVDVIGGLNDAIAIAAKMGNTQTYSLETYPKVSDPITEMLKGFNSEMKMDLLREAVGIHPVYYQHIKQLQQMQGVQARLPFTLLLD